MRVVVLLAMFLGIALDVLGQFSGSPFVGNVFNAASRAPKGMYNSAFAPGSLIEINGFGIGPPNRVTSSLPLTTSLGGTSVALTVDGEKVEALIFSAGFGYVVALIPSSTPVGDGLLRLNYLDQVSNPIPVKIVRSAFGIFTRNGSGTGPAIVQNGFDDVMIPPPVNAITHTARAGDMAILWGTGLGPVAGRESAGPLPGNMELDVKVLVGGKPAEISYRGRSSCCTGIDEIHFKVPDDALGCRIPIVVKTGETLSNFATMSIGTGDRSCMDIPGMSPENYVKLSQGGEVLLGQLNLTRIDLRVEVAGTPTSSITEILLGDFVRYRSEDALASQSMGSNALAGAPSPNHCVVIPADGNYGLLVPVITDPTIARDRGALLNAGSQISIQGSTATSQVYRGNDKYWDIFGGFVFYDRKTLPLVMDAGEVTLTNGDGGKDVGSFQAKLTLPKPVTWKNMDDLKEVPRDQDLTVTWESETPSEQQVVLMGISDSGWQGTIPTALLCTAPAAAGQITVPSWLLKTLPATGVAYGLPLGYLGLATQPTRLKTERFTAQGIDAGNLQYTFLTLKSMAFR